LASGTAGRKVAKRVTNAFPFLRFANTRRTIDLRMQEVASPFLSVLTMPFVGFASKLAFTRDNFPFTPDAIESARIGATAELLRWRTCSAIMLSISCDVTNPNFMTFLQRVVEPLATSVSIDGAWHGQLPIGVLAINRAM
jgi:hypothetical protein